MTLRLRPALHVELRDLLGTTWARWSLASLLGACIGCDSVDHEQWKLVAAHEPPPHQCVTADSTPELADAPVPLTPAQGWTEFPISAAPSATDAPQRREPAPQTEFNTHHDFMLVAASEATRAPGAETSVKAPVDIPQANITWPLPEVLIEDLQKLPSRSPAQTKWAETINTLMVRLHDQPELSSDDVDSLLAALQQQIPVGNRLADELSSQAEQAELRRITYAVQRRVDVWRAISLANRAENLRRVRSHVASVDPRKMATICGKVQQTLQGGPAGTDWGEFLRLNDLQVTAQSSAGHDVAARQQLANHILRSIAKANLSAEQQQFLAADPLGSLQEELRTWATHSFDFVGFAKQLESFERRPTNSSSRELSKHWIALKMSLNGPQQKVADAFEAHYRNANVRLSVTEDMLNRLVPELPQSTEPVNENVLETRVVGQSTTDTRLHVNLLPANDRMRVLLEARGNMQAATTSRKGPATLFNRSQSRYVVKRVVTMDRDGIQLGNTNAVASADTNLVGLRTIYDRMPIVGSVVRNVAKKTYDEQRGLARRLMAHRVTNQASQRLEEAMDKQLASAQQKFEDKVSNPLRALALDPVAMEMTTSDDRLVLRTRLAADIQTAAFTPRPRAIADNLLSFQVHESAMNNFVQQLELDGKKGTLEELHAHVVNRLQETLNFTPKEVELQPGVRMKLADEDAVSVQCVEGDIMLSIKFDKLVVAGPVDEKVYSKFTVQVMFRPEHDGLQAYLQRKEIRVVGRFKGEFRRAALASMFGLVFPEDRRLPLIDPKIVDDQRFAGLQVGQLYIDHGWLGLSLVETPPKENVITAKQAAKTGHR